MNATSTKPKDLIDFKDDLAELQGAANALDLLCELVAVAFANGELSNQDPGPGLFGLEWLGRTVGRKARDLMENVSREIG